MPQANGHSLHKDGKVNTAILISGRGSNMEALIKASKAPDYPARISLVISNRLDAAGLERARSHGVKAVCIDHSTFDTRESFETALHQALIYTHIELICCAGFMRILSPYLVRRWEKRMLNIHPSLLPKYKGLHTHERALKARETYHGCSVHWVSEELDGGEVVMQDKIRINKTDNAESLAARLLPVELALYPKALAKVANDIKTYAK